MLKKKKKKKELWLQCCCIGILETLAHGEKEFTNGMRLQKKQKNKQFQQPLLTTQQQ
jgi:hypothetical protein